MEDMSDFGNLLGGLDGEDWADAGDGTDAFGLGAMGESVDPFMSMSGAEVLGLGSDIAYEEGDVLTDMHSENGEAGVAPPKTTTADPADFPRVESKVPAAPRSSTSSRRERSEASVRGDGDRSGAMGNGGAKSPGTKRKRQNLTPDERLKQNRDRNREHARNTRLRKKAFVEELKRTVQDLVAKREREVRQRRMLAARSREQHEVQLKVLSTFLNYRGLYVLDRRKWSAIMNPNFTMVLPLTRYRVFDEDQVTNNHRELTTLDAVVDDVLSLKKFAISLLRGKLAPEAQAQGLVTFHFRVELKDVIYKGDSLMAVWTAASEGYAAHGARELSCRGMAHVIFDKVNKIKTVELMWDSLGVSRSFARVARGLLLAEDAELIASLAPNKVQDDEDGSPAAVTAATSDIYRASEVDLLRQLLEDVCADRVCSTVVKRRPEGGGNGVQRTFIRLYPLSVSDAAEGAAAKDPAAVKADPGLEKDDEDAAPSKETVHFVGVLEDLPPIAGATTKDSAERTLMSDQAAQKNSSRRSKRSRPVANASASSMLATDQYDHLADDESGDDMVKLEDSSRRKHARKAPIDEVAPSPSPASTKQDAQTKPRDASPGEGSGEDSRRQTRSASRKY
mmetsp:Transcript_4762/g.19064  ORF Transcript_4762/g.19064 Transcript_4762/m.19064 type:complete len:621 (-) Transcript_4762:294-2156(-)